MMEQPVILAYIGPETILPVASVIGAIVGIVLMIWQRVVSFVSGAYARLSGKLPPAQWPSKER
jgi:hypothetical protein